MSTLNSGGGGIGVFASRVYVEVETWPVGGRSKRFGAQAIASHTTPPTNWVLCKIDAAPTAVLAASMAVADALAALGRQDKELVVAVAKMEAGR